MHNHYFCDTFSAQDLLQSFDLKLKIDCRNLQLRMNKHVYKISMTLIIEIVRDAIGDVYLNIKRKLQARTFGSLSILCSFVAKRFTRIFFHFMRLIYLERK